MIPKFRAWDSEANIMIYSDHRTRKLYDVYYGFEMNEKGELECRWEGDFTESQVLDGGILDNIMQSTGVKDKNGVEICEGDVLFHPLQGRMKVFYPYSKTVASYGLRNIDNGFGSTLQDSHAVWEVIGNIHENQELLEVDE